MLDDPLFLVAVNMSAAILIRVVYPNMASAVLLAVVVIAATGYLGTHHGSEVLMAAYSGRDSLLSMSGDPPSWPPEKLRHYPDLELVNQEGGTTRLSKYRGKVIIVQPVAVASPACIAFAGGHQRGPFQGTRPQPNLESLMHYAYEFGKVALSDDDIVFVQLLLFNRDMEPPSVDDVRMWANHFGMRVNDQQIVLAATPELVDESSRSMIPGFHLIDRNFVLRANATGAEPEDSLYTDLLPMIGKLVAER